MKDRVVQYPHRYQLVPVAGESDTYDIIAKPGTVTEAGTPINKATLLSDETAALYGLTGEDATVDGALATIPGGYQSAIKSYGSVEYVGALASQEKSLKKIAVGSGKKFGRCVIKANLSQNPSSGMIFFCDDPTKTMSIENMSTNTTSITHGISGHALRFSAIAATGGIVYVNSVRINGNDLEIELQNRDTSSYLEYNCSIYWEVW